MRLFLVLAALVSAALCACPADWEDRGDYCFHVSSGKETFEQARDRCLEMGGQMAQIDGTAKKIIYDTFASIMNNFMLGLQFSPLAGWRWLDGKPVVYQNWMRGQKLDDTADSCAMVLPNGEWKTVSCRDKLRFICEQAKPMTGTFMSVQSKNARRRAVEEAAELGKKEEKATADPSVQDSGRLLYRPPQDPASRPYHPYRPYVRYAADPVAPFPFVFPPFPFAFPSFPFAFPFSFPAFSWDPFGISSSINSYINSMTNTIGAQMNDMIRQGVGHVVESTSTGPGFSGVATGSSVTAGPDGRFQRRHYSWTYP